jgi:hypothetical protein
MSAQAHLKSAGELTDARRLIQRCGETAAAFQIF